MGRSSLTGQLLLVFIVSFVYFVDCCDSCLPDMVHMDLLSKFGVTVNQTREEFIDALCIHQLSNLKTLWQDLFMILVSNDLLLDNFKGLPLVARRNSPTRSIYKLLSEDCWIISDCIVNETSIPRTLLKNGKHGKSFVSSQPRPHPSDETLSQESHQIDQPPSSIPCPNVDLPRLHNSESISNRLMVTEIATLKADLNSTKADLRECLLMLDSSTSHVHPLAQ